MASRQRLIEAARAELIATSGSIEVAAVARRAGVSVGLLYRYFDAKAGLVSAVVHAFYDAYDTSVLTARIAPGVHWMERERERLRREIDFLFDDPLAAIVVARRLSEPAAAQVDTDRMARQIGIVARGIARGQRDGELDASTDPRLVAAAFVGAFRELMAEALRREDPPPRERLLETACAVGRSIVPVTGPQHVGRTPYG
ncbi:TetR/AcrR family transcriptional regulator [Allonocardiopsis opalescens]|nr:TetR/AcrR family transcriptional regulator [Allonocardiopsis opalescens]